MYHENAIPLAGLADMNAQLLTIRGDGFKYLAISEDRKAIRTEIYDVLVPKVNQIMAEYRATSLSEIEKQKLADFDQSWAAYQAAMTKMLGLVDAGKVGDALFMSREGGELILTRTAVQEAVKAMIEENLNEAKDLNDQGQAIRDSSRLVMILVGLIAALVSFGLGLLITRNISVPLAAFIQMMKNLAVGDLNREMSMEAKKKLTGRKDEIGELARELDAAQDYMIEMSGAARSIAGGDLTVMVEPKSEKDELGQAFAEMAGGLRVQVGHLVESAGGIASASTQLASAAAQAGQATSQISMTIQQVASGITQQSQSINTTASSVEPMTRAIDGIARGAQEQSAAVNTSTLLTAKISSAVQQVSGNAAAVSRDSAEANKAARAGAQTVKETLKGMERIREKVGDSARKVEEMGRRSDQIGAIVEVIEDIASQTNLLALNAAIEAARAGEHGKGVAVVADEVRKLSERASSSTKEISALIKSIQGVVADAVASMNAGGKEVEQGVARANEAGQALESILQAAEAVNRQAELASAAAAQMTGMATELVSSANRVSAVVEENTASTEEMAASSSQVTQSIENIASISEENSAAIEEVSASTEQMTAQVEEVSASAGNLADMARILQDVVAQFRLELEDVDEHAPVRAQMANSRGIANPQPSTPTRAVPENVEIYQN
jgi:methyl-accepting chemotaxis protein